MPHDPEPLSGPPRDSGGLTPPGSPGKPDPLAASLARLEPAAPAINRDRLMFTAGAASRANVIRLWQFAAGFMAFVGFFAGVNYRNQNVVYIERPSPGDTSNVVGNAAPNNTALPEWPKSEPPTPQPPESEPVDASPLTESGFFYLSMPETPEWLQRRNDILNGGLGVLPDPGRQSRPAPDTDIRQPGTLPRGMGGQN